MLAFTGSSNTGVVLRGGKAVLAHSVRVNVEADSLNAAVLGPDVEDDSDVMNLFITDVARDATQKTGQKCTAIRRVYVPAAKVSVVVEKLRERLLAIKVGDPAREETTMGPLATAQQLKDVRDGVAKLATCAKVVLGARGAWARRGFFLAPTLLVGSNPKPGDAVHLHEVFGPVTTVMPYDGSADHAARLVAAGGGGLVSSVYSDDKEFVHGCVLGIAPFHGRVTIGSSKVAAQAIPPGTVLPSARARRPGSRRRRRRAGRAARTCILHAAGGAAGRPRSRRGDRRQTLSCPCSPREPQFSRFARTVSFLDVDVVRVGHGVMLNVRKWAGHHGPRRCTSATLSRCVRAQLLDFGKPIAHSKRLACDVKSRSETESTIRGDVGAAPPFNRFARSDVQLHEAPRGTSVASRLAVLDVFTKRRLVCGDRREEQRGLRAAVLAGEERLFVRVVDDGGEIARDLRVASAVNFVSGCPREHGRDEPRDDLHSSLLNKREPDWQAQRAGWSQDARPMARSVDTARACGRAARCAEGEYEARADQRERAGVSARSRERAHAGARRSAREREVQDEVRGARELQVRLPEPEAR